MTRPCAFVARRAASGFSFQAKIAMALAMLAVLLCSAGTAFAHASLINADPRDGAMIADAPKHFNLTFSEPVSPLVLKLVAPGGDVTSLDRFVLEGNTLIIEAPADLGRGTHALSWRVVSTDGHPVGGAVVFSIGAPSAGPIPDVEDSVDWPVRIAFWTARLGVYTGLFIGVGGVFFASWMGQGGRRAAFLTCATMVLGLIAATISLGLQGADALNATLRELNAAIIWRTGFQTTYGNTVLVAGFSLVAGLIAIALRGLPAKALSLLAFLGVGSALAASGHASAAPPEWLTRPAVFLHGICIAFWAGALMPLGFALASSRADATAVLRGFSRAIPYALASLIASGLLLAVVQLQSIEALWTTAYGKVFLIKLALLVVVFALAAMNRFRLTQPAEQGDGPSTRLLRRSILLETMLILAIFGVAALWRFTPPPRALAEAAAAPAAIHIHTAKAMADLTITPGHTGAVTASMILMNGDFGPLPAKEVTLTLANAVAGVEPIKRSATRPGDGTWQIIDLPIPVPGRWSVRIDILVSDFELAKLEGEIDIRR